MKKRILLSAAGVNILAAGIILNTKSTLGVGAINTLPCAGAEISGVTLGTATALIYLLFIALQCILMKKADIAAFLQLPFSFLFGLVLNFYDSVLGLTVASPAGKLTVLCAAILLTAFGTYLMTVGNIILNPPDGMVRALSEIAKKPLGLVRNLFDCGMILTAAVFSLLLTGRTIGIGIGTVLSALLIGRFIALFQRVFSREMAPHAEKS